MSKPNIAIIGATGLVGSTFLSIIEERNIEYNELFLFASSKSNGKEITVNGETITVLELSINNILNKDIDYALFSAGGSISAQFAPVFKSIGAIVIDNSSAFRMDEDVPLVVPEVNMIDAYANLGIIANPNCSTIQAMLPLKVLQEHYGLVHVRYATYQAVSGSGNGGIEDLKNTSEGKPASTYPYPIYNNVLPHIDVFLENGYTKEEIKMMMETKKILHLPNLDVTATCVRVPVLNSHSVEIHVELASDFNLDTLKNQLSNQEGITIVDDPSTQQYPFPTMATGKDDVFVGRVRKDLNNKRRLHLFVVADNIRKGAALNAVQIMEELMKGVV